MCRTEFKKVGSPSPIFHRPIKYIRVELEFPIFEGR